MSTDGSIGDPQLTARVVLEAASDLIEQHDDPDVRGGIIALTARLLVPNVDHPVEEANVRWLVALATGVMRI